MESGVTDCLGIEIIGLHSRLLVDATTTIIKQSQLGPTHMKTTPIYLLDIFQY